MLKKKKKKEREFKKKLLKRSVLYFLKFKGIFLKET